MLKSSSLGNGMLKSSSLGLWCVKVKFSGLWHIKIKFTDLRLSCFLKIVQFEVIGSFFLKVMYSHWPHLVWSEQMGFFLKADPSVSSIFSSKPATGVEAYKGFGKPCGWSCLV